VVNGTLQYQPRTNIREMQKLIPIATPARKNSGCGAVTSHFRKLT
jgi:hypothetical protein